MVYFYKPLTNTSTSLLQSCLEQGYNRLELRFRPDDIYCKPAIGRPSKTCCLALKIKRKKDQPESMSIEHDEVEEYKYSAEILGLVDTIFEFSGQCICYD